jgi:hypothetical protein
MVSQLEFRRAAELAIQNVVKHGDTDIFPFPFENHAFYDKRAEVVELVIEYDTNFEEYLARFSPLNVSSLTPVTYSGFRWATQIDPIWNAHFLACVLALSRKMEDARIPKSDNVVFIQRVLECAHSNVRAFCSTAKLEQHGTIFCTNVGGPKN